MTLPLDGLTILEWTEWGQGPMACSLLGDMGADIIKIEHPVRGDSARGFTTTYGMRTEFPGGKAFFFEGCNRNKKGITVDLTKATGRDIAYRLVKKSDVFVRSFREDTAAKLGLDYKALSTLNPQLIYATCSAYGPVGPLSQAPGFDAVGNAQSGMLYRVAGPDMRITNLLDGIADQAGGIMLALAILAAVVAKEKHGIGQQVETSLLGSMVFLQRMVMEYGFWARREWPPRQERTKAPNPMVNLYQCRDGEWISLVLFQGQKYWPAFCKALGLGNLADDPRFRDGHQRLGHAIELIAILDKTFATKDCSEWEKILKEQDFAFSRVLKSGELATHDQALANDYVIEYKHPTAGPIKMVGFPVTFGKTRLSVRRPAPEFGQHTEEVLADFGGFSWAEIEEFRKAKVI